MHSMCFASTLPADTWVSLPSKLNYAIAAHQWELSPNQLAEEYGLTEAQVSDALGFYAAHQTEIDRARGSLVPRDQPKAGTARSQQNRRSKLRMSKLCLD